MNTSLQSRNSAITPALVKAVEMWADARTTASSKRRHDLLRDKTNILLGDGHDGNAAGFFVCLNKPVEQITPADVKFWQGYLEDMGLAPAGVYARISRVSSFYNWLMEDPTFKEMIKLNPAQMARPKAPKAYQSAKANALTDDDAGRLLQYVRDLAKGDDLSAKRDYALLRFFFATGKRRSEIVDLRWKDITLQKSSVILHTEEKGGLYRSTEIRDWGVFAALRAYLIASDRWDALTNEALLQPESPVWLRHDRAAKGQEAVTSHGFVFMFKKYAKAVGLGDIHLHQTRHTVARMVGEQSGDLSEVQTVLGHQNIATTRVYLARVAVKKDRHSTRIAGRLGLDAKPPTDET
ncbi:MAG: tyrosine-type recombinase/integrase [Phototrophicaceae bacterium]